MDTYIDRFFYIHIISLRVQVVYRDKAPANFTEEINLKPLGVYFLPRWVNYELYQEGGVSNYLMNYKDSRQAIHGRKLLQGGDFMISSIGSSANDMATRMWNRLIKNDSDADGKLSKSEMQTAFANMPAPASGAPGFEEIFSQTDTDGDGAVSQEEFSSFQKTHKPPGPQGGGGVSISDMQEKLWQSVLSQADNDSDSSVSKTEFEKALSSSSASVTTTEADDLFAKIDTDEDGQMNQTEFSTYMEANKPSRAAVPPPPPPPSFDTDSTSTTSTSGVSGTKSADLFSAIDTSGDGKISEDEFDNFSNLLMQQLQAYLNTYSEGMSNYSGSLYSEYSA